MKHIKIRAASNPPSEHESATVGRKRGSIVADSYVGCRARQSSFLTGLYREQRQSIDALFGRPGKNDPFRVPSPGQEGASCPVELPRNIDLLQYSFAASPLWYENQSPPSRGQNPKE